MAVYRPFCVQETYGNRRGFEAVAKYLACLGVWDAFSGTGTFNVSNHLWTLFNSYVQWPHLLAVADARRG